MIEAGAQGATMYKNRLFSYGLTNEPKPKIFLQSLSQDRFIYGSLLDDPLKYKDRQFKGTRIGTALGKIDKAIEEHVNQNGSPDDAIRAYRGMLVRLLGEVEIVRITAPSEKDAFRLFETLNDRGLDLSAADLIKNKLFYQCSPDIDDAMEAWAQVVQLTREDNAVNFLRY